MSETARTVFWALLYEFLLANPVVVTAFGDLVMAEHFSQFAAIIFPGPVRRANEAFDSGNCKGIKNEQD